MGATGDGGKVFANGKLYPDGCAYAVIKNLGGKVKTYKENIYTPMEGVRLIASKTDRSRYYIGELNGRSAKQVYMETLGITESKIATQTFKNPFGKLTGEDVCIISIKEVQGSGIACFRQVNEVWEVFDKHRQTKAAMKMIDLEKPGGEESYERERMVLSAQTERFFRVLFDSFRDGAMGILVMEYVEGIQLKEWVERQGALSPQEAEGFLEQVCRMLEFLHGLHPPVLYLDLKPENLILEPSGRLRLLDFGASRTGEERSLGVSWGSSGVYGTPGYSAPEVWQPEARRPPDKRSDIYSLGALLFYLLSAFSPDKPPYQIMDPEDFVPGLSRGYGELIRRACEQDPEKRFVQVEEFRSELSRAGKKRGLFLRHSFGRHLRILDNVWKTKKLYPGLFLIALAAAFSFPIKAQESSERIYCPERYLKLKESYEQRDTDKNASSEEEESFYSVPIPEILLLEKRENGVICNGEGFSVSW